MSASAHVLRCRRKQDLDCAVARVLVFAPRNTCEDSLHTHTRTHIHVSVILTEEAEHTYLQSHTQHKYRTIRGPNHTHTRMQYAHTHHGTLHEKRTEALVGPGWAPESWEVRLHAHTHAHSVGESQREQGHSTRIHTHTHRYFYIKERGKRGDSHLVSSTRTQTYMYIHNYTGGHEVNSHKRTNSLMVLV